EYEQSLKDEYREGQLHDYVDNYIKDNSTVNKFPNKFLKQLEATTKYADVQSYEYMNQMYSQYGMEAGSFDDFVGKTGEEYDADVIDRAQKFGKADLVYQAVLESEGITFTPEESEAIVREMYDDDEQTFNSFIEQYGKGYTMKQAVQKKAVDIALEGATVK
ncbi:MAG: hypothetical protein IJI51_01845, partial [Lachnospiraceae bacterium]|nr:hypothetical protein [Lachnospiraceae bacterium]